MRRFELVDGKSNKFWEIDREGTSYTVRYGRIGTSGQTTNKSFGDEAAAQGAYEKVIKEKTGKGYVEVGEDAAPAPASAAAAPALASAAPAPALSSAAGASEDASSTPARAPAAAVAPPGPATPASSARSSSFTVTDEMRTRALPSRDNPKGTYENNTSLIEAHIAQHGVVGTIDALLADQIQPMRIYGARGVLRHLATAPEDEWAKARDHIRARFEERFARWDTPEEKGSPRAMSGLLAYLLPEDPSLAERVIEKNLEDWQSLSWNDQYPCYSALNCVRDATLLDRLLASPQAVQAYATALDPLTLMVRMGADAMPRIAAIWPLISGDGPAAQYVSPEKQGEYLAALAAAPTEASFAHLLARGEERSIVPHVATASENAPDVVMRVALPIAVRSQRPTLARDLVERLVRRDPSLAELATTDGHKLLVGALRAEADLPIAEADALPEVLRSPPWKGRKIAKPIVVELAAPDAPDAMVWPPKMREEWSVIPGYFGWGDTTVRSDRALRSLCYGSNPKTGEEAVTALGASLARGDWAIEYGAEALPALAEPFLSAMWNAMDPTAWKLSTPIAKTLVAKLELGALEGLLVRAGLATARSGLLGKPRRTNALAQTLEASLPIRSLRLAKAAAIGLTMRSARKPAQAWILAHPETAARGLVPLATAKPGKERTGAETGLRLLAASDHAQAVRDAATAHGARALEAVEAILAADPLALAKAPSTPKWLRVRELPPVLTRGGARLSDASREIVIGMLAASQVDAPYAGLEPASDACDPASLGSFGWSLFRQWWMAEAPNNDLWAFTGLAHLGDDQVVSRLAPLVAIWPNDGLAKRAQTGVDILGTIGTDAALIALHRFSRKAKTKGLKASAAEKMDEIAEARGLSPDELADRLTPDLGLDEDGTLALDLGDRSLTVGFDEQLCPFVKDADGARIPKFPAATKGMDKQKHKDAKSRFKQLEKEAKEVALHVLSRFENAMANGRSWPIDVADKCFFHHPMMRHLAAHVAWMELDADLKVRSVFRVAEDGTFADPNDELHRLGEGASVALLHPLRVESATVARLSEIFGDYEILQPFEQLGRPTYALEASERKGERLARYRGRAVPTGRIFSLEKRGWTRDTIGVSQKSLPEGSASLVYTPGIDGSPDAWHENEQTLGDLILEGTTFEALDGVVLSELLYDVERMFDGS